MPVPFLKSKRVERLIIVLMVVQPLLGCQLFSNDPTDPAFGYPPYFFGFVNLSNAEIDEVKLFMMHRGDERLVGFAGSLRPTKFHDENGAEGKRGKGDITLK